MISSEPQIRFVLPEQSEAEIGRMKKLDLKRDWMAFNLGAAAEILQGYIRLRGMGFNVELDNKLSPDAINIVFVVDLARMSVSKNCFVVGMRADYTPCRGCHLEIVTNSAQLGPHIVWIPTWPQPGLIPRDEARGTLVKRVGYFGRQINHYTRIFRRASGFFRV